LCNFISSLCFSNVFFIDLIFILLLQTPSFHTSRNKSVNNSNHDEVFAYPTRKNKRLSNSNSAPRREGLRPRRSPGGRLLLHYQESEDEEDDDEEEGDTSDTDDKGAQKENGNVNSENGNEEDEEEEADGGDEADEEEEDGDEQEGRRRYDLRDRSEVRRSSPGKGEKQRAPRSPRRILHHGMGLGAPRNSR
jgi:ATPase family AAA domain-containing protein 2